LTADGRGLAHQAPTSPAPPELGAGGAAWHTRTAAEVTARFGVRPDQGLTREQAARQFRRCGSNDVPDIPRRPRRAILREQVVSVPLLMLSAAAVLSFATGAAVDALFIGGAVVANAALGYFTEDRAEQTVQSLRQTRAPEAQVRRDGSRALVPLEQVVPGDVLLLEPGQLVPADGRVVLSESLLTDESLLTGESAARQKGTDPLPFGAWPLAERANMVHAGSAVAGGRGLAVVTATGPHSELGRIRALIGQAPDVPPPMTRELQRLGGTLAVAATGVSAVFGLIGLGIGLPPAAVLALTASLAVSAIPEGLPTVSTTALALGMSRMRARNVVIRRLPAVAALGSATMLCVDKTGTLTENRMSARAFVLGDAETDVAEAPSGGGLRCLRHGQLMTPQDDPRLLRALQIGALCTEAEAKRSPDGTWEVHGSGTEAALLRAALTAGLDVARWHATLPPLHRQGRAPGRNHMVSVHRHPGGTEVFVKGAPEEVLALCALGRSERKTAVAWNERLAARGMRVLGLAHAVLPPGQDWEGAALDWVGLVGLEDPLRDEAHEAVAQLAGAGIRTLMLTGDQSRTAEAVGRAIGLNRHGPLRVADAAGIAESLTGGRPLPDVLARVSPADKYEIVRLLQERGHVVMMTGDGINDTPALKAADIGVAMGARSTQTARDLADVILLDDNLANLPTAVGQGRTIFTNIRKAVRFLLASNLADIGLIGACLVLGLSFPLTALQLLWMNLVSDVFPAIALAMEPPEARTMSRPPRPPQEPLLPRSLWKIITREAATIAALTLGSYLWGLGRYGQGARARTLAFTTVCLSEILYALACRTEGPQPKGVPRPPNRSLTTFLGVSAAAQVGTVALPPLRRLLGTTPLSAADWLVVAASSGAALGVTSALKRLPAPRIPTTRLPAAPALRKATP